uniref:Uncharacterized protein n=1 Tax=Gossypium raimondii TaxID=29730 RepID=A0A0D2SB76_GOSRA|nr:hypothetical protein B456_007G322200 [Gossypium raimondii]
MTLACCFVLGCRRHPRSPRMGSQFLNGFSLVPSQTGVGLSYPPWLGSIYIFFFFSFSVYDIFPCFLT